jgi:hypothetical protein
MLRHATGDDVSEASKVIKNATMVSKVIVATL